ncbi:DDE-type integrase/transposase/recombinase [Aeribacillus pallidus]|uniref:DDE-type integrase/transposase/recombinase n=1 Tax=Aeribacillus pallidus TaxID=33936 RepID=UPI0026CE6CD1
MDGRYYVHSYRRRLVVFSEYHGLYTRKIVGWYIDTRMTKELVIKALQRALNSEKPTGRMIHHSDRGS